MESEQAKRLTNRTNHQSHFRSLTESLICLSPKYMSVDCGSWGTQKIHTKTQENHAKS